MKFWWETDEIRYVRNFIKEEWLAIPRYFSSMSKDPGGNYEGFVYQFEGKEKELWLKRMSEALDADFDLTSSKIRFRVTTTQDKGTGKSFVHVDPFEVVGIIYLTKLPEECDLIHYGTVFYKHKRSGKVRFPATDLKEKFKRDFLLSLDSLRAEEWEVVKRVPFEANAGVFFGGDRFHSSSKNYFGDHHLEGRMTIDFFGKLRTDDER